MPTAHVFFAFVDGSEPAGLITSFEGFSTFKCKRLLSIHDCAVLPEYRNRGVCKAMLTFVQEFARSRDMCKLTLEVLSNNDVAKRAYTSFGFEAYALLEESGTAHPRLLIYLLGICSLYNSVHFVVLPYVFPNSP